MPEISYPRIALDYLRALRMLVQIRFCFPHLLRQCALHTERQSGFVVITMLLFYERLRKRPYTRLRIARHGFEKHMPHLRGGYLLAMVIALKDLERHEEARRAARTLHASAEMMAMLTEDYRRWIVDLLAYYDRMEQEPAA